MSKDREKYLKEIDPELIQFFEEHQEHYNFLLHRTRDEQGARSILENGLYFEEMLNKVTDPIIGAIESSLIGNRVFFQSYGRYILIIAIPKEVNEKYDKLVTPVSKEALTGIFDPDEIEEFTDMYHLSSKYILGYNKAFTRKLNFNRRFEKDD